MLFSLFGGPVKRIQHFAEQRTTFVLGEMYFLTTFCAVFGAAQCCFRCLVATENFGRDIKHFVCSG